MKTVLLFILLTLTSPAFTQTDTILANIFPFKDGKILYSQTITKSSNAFNKAIAWVQSNQTHDEGNATFNEVAGIISASKTFGLPVEIPLIKGNKTIHAQWNYSFSLHLSFTGNQINVTATNFQLSGTNTTQVNNVEDYLPSIRSINNAAHMSNNYQRKFEAAVYNNYSEANSKVLSILKDLSNSLGNSYAGPFL